MTVGSAAANWSDEETEDPLYAIHTVQVTSEAKAILIFLQQTLNISCRHSKQQS
jgi:hypothetical protein